MNGSLKDPINLVKTLPDDRIFASVKCHRRVSRITKLETVYWSKKKDELYDGLSIGYFHATRCSKCQTTWPTQNMAIPMAAGILSVVGNSQD